MKRAQSRERACPYWLAGTLDNPLRRWLHKPEKILDGLVREGQTVLDLGCGPGYFSVGMARMVGEEGRVIAVDLQAGMLELVRRKAERAGLLQRIQLHQCAPDRIGIGEKVDFALAFWMVHEVPDPDSFLNEVRTLLKPEGRFLLVEPDLHVAKIDFQKTLDRACAVGMKPVKELKVSISRSMLFQG